MTIREKLEADFLVSVKSRAMDRVGVLRMLKAAIQNKQIDSKEPLTDEQVLAILKSEMKKRKDSIEQFRAGNREDLAAKEVAEIAIIQEYLPAALSIEEVTAKVTDMVAGIPETERNFGKMMGMAMKLLGTSADGTMVQQVLKSLVEKK